MPIELSGKNESGRFEILLDRQSALDIGAFCVDGVDLSPGMAIPSDGDPRIDRALQGFFFTCGPDHIRHPEPIEDDVSGATYPLHGSLCGTAVSSTAMAAPGEPDGCVAETRVALAGGVAGGGTATVERRWSMSADASEVTLHDTVRNSGSRAFAPMMMYHINIGGWLLADDSRVVSDALPGGAMFWRFGDGQSAHLCRPAPSSGGWSTVALGPFPQLAQRSLHVRFRTDTLPFLQIWRCQRGAADVFSIEPVSHRLARRDVLTESGELPLLQPGDVIDYALAFSVA